MWQLIRAVSTRIFSRRQTVARVSRPVIDRPRSRRVERVALNTLDWYYIKPASWGQAAPPRAGRIKA